MLDLITKMDDNLKQLTEEVERELLLEIAESLKSRRISVEETKKLAQDFLQLLPIKDKQDLLNKLKMLGNRYFEAKDVYLKHVEEDYAQKRDIALSTIANHVKAGEIEKAIEVAKGGIDNG